MSRVGVPGITDSSSSARKLTQRRPDFKRYREPFEESLAIFRLVEDSLYVRIMKSSVDSSRVRRVRRCETLRIGDITPKQRKALEQPLVDIVRHWYAKTERWVIVEKMIFRSPDSLLRVMYDADDEIVGCATLQVEPRDTPRGKCAIFDAGAYFHPDSKGCDLYAVRLGLRVAAAYKLRHPLTPMLYIGAAATPASYRFLADSCFQIYPRPNERMPEGMDVLAADMATERGLVVSCSDPVIVSLPEPDPLRQPKRLLRSKRLQKDPAAQWFTEKNPEYAKGFWMMVHVPLTLANLTATAFKFIAHHWLPAMLGSKKRKRTPTVATVVAEPNAALARDYSGARAVPSTAGSIGNSNL